MLKCRSIDSPMDVNTKLLPDQGELLEDVGRYRRLVRKLNYLTVIRPDITFTVSNNESIFVSTEDYSLGGDNESFEVPEESSSESASLFRSWISHSSGLLRCRLCMMPFW